MKHILMVDDVTTNLKSAGEVLQPYYKVSMAKSGKQALKFLEKNKPDLILLDIMMPDMDGYQTMEEIKLDPSTANIPIIFLTADTEQESEIKGIQMGAMDFITKPFAADVMLARVAQVLQMDEMRKNIMAGAGETISNMHSFMEWDELITHIDSEIYSVSNHILAVVYSDKNDIDDAIKSYFPYFCKKDEQHFVLWSKDLLGVSLDEIVNLFRDNCMIVGLKQKDLKMSSALDMFYDADKALYHARKSGFSVFVYEP